MNRDTIASWLQRRLHRLGLDIIRYPSPRLRGGHMVHLLRDLEIDVVLDVGGNVGQYGQFLRGLGYEGTIVSFEPVAESFEALSAVAAADPRWHVVRTALGVESGTVTMTVTRASVMASMRTPRASNQTGIGGDLDAVRSEEVPLARLDEIFADHVPPGSKVFAKFAVQGSDVEVLRGAAGCLPDVLALQIAVSIIPIYEGMPTWVESLAHARSYGFELTGMFPSLYNGPYRVVEFDAIMVRPD